MTSAKISLGAALLVAILCLPLAFAGEAPDVQSMIHSAATRDDHEALAAHFERQAVDAGDNADRHRMMAERYRKAGGVVVEEWHLDRHCEELAEAFGRVAKENAALAKAHRGIAGNMK